MSEVTKKLGARLRRDIKGIFIRPDGKVRKVKIIIFSVILLALIWGFIENGILTQNEYTITSPDLPESFSGYKIAQISDLHNAEFGRDNRRLLDKLEDIDPDIIVITGDIVDSVRTDVDTALEFCRGSVKIAPTYYVTGNHESAVSEYKYLESEMARMGVRILKNEAIEIEKGGERIILAGIDDPTLSFVDTKTLDQILEGEGYHVLLSHRPELFSMYVSSGADLVFTGHAHGGQFRIPFVGGVVAPNQGFFPEYDSGLYRDGNTNMIVSRGIGNSIIPIRFNNLPEIVVAELIKE